MPDLTLDHLAIALMETAKGMIASGDRIGITVIVHRPDPTHGTSVASTFHDYNDVVELLRLLLEIERAEPVDVDELMGTSQ